MLQLIECVTLLTALLARAFETVGTTELTPAGVLIVVERTEVGALLHAVEATRWILEVEEARLTFSAGSNVHALSTVFGAGGGSMVLLVIEVTWSLTVFWHALEQVFIDNEVLRKRAADALVGVRDTVTAVRAAVSMALP